MQATRLPQLRGCRMRPARRLKQLAVSLNNDALKAELLTAVGSAYLKAGDFGRATAVLERAVDQTRRLGLLNSLLRALGNLGACYRRNGDLQGARDLQEESLRLSRQTGDDRSLAWDLLNLTDLCLEAGDVTMAQSYSQEALALSR